MGNANVAHTCGLMVGETNLGTTKGMAIGNRKAIGKRNHVTSGQILGDAGLVITADLRMLAQEAKVKMQAPERSRATTAVAKVTSSLTAQATSKEKVMKEVMKEDVTSRFDCPIQLAEKRWLSGAGVSSRMSWLAVRCRSIIEGGLVGCPMQEYH